MKNMHFAMLAASAAMAALSSPALAAGTPVPDPSTCQLIDVANAIDCVGYYGGNIFSNSPDNTQTQLWGLQDLGFVGSPDFDAIYAVGSGLKNDLVSGSTSTSFAGAPVLFGITYFGIHWGGNQSAIFKLNFLTPTSSVTFDGFNPGGSSNAVLFSTSSVPSVPEPASWALLIAGLGTVGFAMRRRKVAVSFA